MSETFNPYSEWLGLPATTRHPNHYELLALPAGESDLKRISLAAEQAATKIRSFRPGSHASAWARLLDDVQLAKLTLLDPARKAAYDRSLSPPSASVSKVASSAPVNPVLADLFPPGFQPVAAASVPDHRAPAPTAASSASSHSVEPKFDPLDGLPPAARAIPPSNNYPAELPQPAVANFAYPTSMPSVPGFGPIDPMAPVAIPGVTSAYVAPMATGYPMAAAVPPLAHPVPIAHPVMPQATHLMAMPAPVPMTGMPATPAMPMPSAALAVPSPSSMVETPGVRKSSAASMMMAARKERRTRSAAILAGGAAGLVIVGGIAAYVAMTSNWSTPADQTIAQATPQESKKVPAKVNEGKQTVPSSVARANPAQAVPVKERVDDTVPPDDSVPPNGSISQPMQVVERPPMPEPKPEPAGTPAPEPTPEPKPDPVPVAKPSRQQVVELEAALKRARLALSEQSFEDADAAAAKAEMAAVLPEHRALIERLRLAIDHTRLFRQVLADAASKLDAAETIKVGSSTVVAVVETFPDKITVRVNGMNRTYSFANIPKGLAVAILDLKRIGGEPDSRLLKAMFVATAKDADQEAQAEARGWLQQVEASDPNAAKLLAFLDDSYDGLVAAFDEAEKNAAASTATAGTSN